MLTVVQTTPSPMHCLASNRNGRGGEWPLISPYVSLPELIRTAATQTSARYGSAADKSSDHGRLRLLVKAAVVYFESVHLLRARRARKISIERHTDPPFLAPDDVARLACLRALNNQREAVRNEQRGYDFDRGPGIRNVANGAVDCSAAERYRSGLQDSMPRCYPVFVHWFEMRWETPYFIRCRS
jgi:hypothetical protein